MRTRTIKVHINTHYSAGPLSLLHNDIFSTIIMDNNNNNYYYYIRTIIADDKDTSRDPAGVASILLCNILIPTPPCGSENNAPTITIIHLSSLLL